MTMVRVRAIALYMGVVSSGSCTDPVQPTLVRDVELAAMELSSYSILADSGLFVVFGTPTDTTRILDPSERIAVSLIASGGDAEAFMLGPIVCDGSSLACHEFGIVMRPGHRVGELFPLLDGIPARAHVTSFEDRIAGVFTFHPERVSSVLPQLRRHSAVESAERSHFAVFPFPPRRFLLRGGLPFDVRAVVSDDGRLQAQPGETVTVRYTQPDDTVLELVVEVLPPT